VQGGNYIYTYEPPVFVSDTLCLLHNYFFLYVSPFRTDYFSKQLLVLVNGNVFPDVRNEVFKHCTEECPAENSCMG